MLGRHWTGLGEGGHASALLTTLITTMCAHDMPLARLPHAASQCEIVEDGERISVARDSRQPGRHTVHLLARDLDGLPLNHPEQGFSVNASRPDASGPNASSYTMPDDSMSIVYAGSNQYDVTIEVHGVTTPRSHPPALCPSHSFCSALVSYLGGVLTRA